MTFAICILPLKNKRNGSDGTARPVAKIARRANKNVQGASMIKVPVPLSSRQRWHFWRRV